MPAWGNMLRLDVSALELMVRTSVIYLVLITALRVVSRREMGSLDLPDLLMLVLISDGVQNGMAGQYTSISGALIVAGTLFGWNYALDWLSYNVPVVRRLLRPRPLLLVKDGQVLRRQMRRELITTEELFSHLREHGIEREQLPSVRRVWMEPDGQLSVFSAEAGTHQSGEQPKRPGAG